MAPHQLVEFRDRLRARMIEHAREDSRCAAAAFLGSAARQSEDEWSDIDLALRLVPGADLDQTAADWTQWLATEVEIADHLDIHAWGALYRVFLCDNALQVDLSLWPWDRFRPVNGEPMKLVFGDCLEPEQAPQRDSTEHAKMTWLYALHARSAVHRGRALQADLMLANWREHIIALAAVRHGSIPAKPGMRTACPTTSRPGSAALGQPASATTSFYVRSPAQLSSTRPNSATTTPTMLTN